MKAMVSIRNPVPALSFLCHPEGRNIFHSSKVSGELFGFGNGMRPLESSSLHAYFADVSKAPAFSAWGQGSGVRGQAAINLAQGILFRRAELLSLSFFLFCYGKKGFLKKTVCFCVVLCLWLFRANLLACKSS